MTRAALEPFVHPGFETITVPGQVPVPGAGGDPSRPSPMAWIISGVASFSTTRLWPRYLRACTIFFPTPSYFKGAFALSKPKSRYLHLSHTDVAKAVGSPQRPQTGLPTYGSASKQARQSASLERRSQPTQVSG